MVAKRFIGIAIVLYWSWMNLLLIQRHSSAPPAVITVQGAEQITERMDEWWGVFYRGEKIGYAAQTIVPKTGGYRLSDQSVLKLNLLGAVQPASTRLEMEANNDWILETFSFELSSADLRFKAQGRVDGTRLSLATESGGHRSERVITLTQAPYLLAALKPYVVTQQLETGKAFHFSTFDPSTLAQQVTTVVIEGREHIEVNGKREPAIKLRQSFRGVSVLSWVDGHGRTLKEQSPGGMSLVRQHMTEAKNLPEQALSVDILAQTAIPVAQPITKVVERDLLQLRLSGIQAANFPLDHGRQSLRGDRLEIRREDLKRIASYSLPARERHLHAFLQPTVFLQADHPRIRAVAKQVLGGETDAQRAVLKLKGWVYNEVAKAPTVSIPSALEVLESRRGDCNEHTVLFNALARAAGIPAKTVVGVVYLKGAFYYHAWSEVWLGDWVSVDSVLNQFPADVSHVRFLEGEIDRQIDLLQLIGNLKIEVL